ncbi:hypothetical protein EUX98_g6817 [Antrodiella citrinella]|uniref:Uncharacterized protein n=1 Tax=Antrodiella citrinella TaxID=2447956 RepID=A0A4S4MNB8_9APHY|nr:hypothetical protein EUX98_g6817 [Antrodiella citrinella]
MSLARRHSKLSKRQTPANPDDVPVISGVTGAQSIAPTSVPLGPIATDPDAPSTFDGGGQPLASITPTITTGPSPTPTPTPTQSDVSESPVAAASTSSSSKLPIGTVVAACVGALVGAIIIVSIFLWWLKRVPPKRPRSANTRAREEQRQARGLSWNRLGDEEDRWDTAGSAAPKVLPMSQIHTDADEKNFSMFKKSNSMRTTRTAKALEEHGIDLPPFQFSPYHSNLAEELSLEQPDKPFATSRKDSTASWDRETVGDDSFLSLRSVRVDSGTMSPTTAHRTTPAASTVSSLHRWESAEVVHVADVSNPFEDVHEERSGDNPFFGGAQDMRRNASRRSRSNSRGSRHSRNTSRASRSRPQSRVRPDSEAQPLNPFNDAGVPVGVPSFPHHAQTDSMASDASGNPFATDQAMKNLIAALNLTPEEVQERLRVASMQASTLSRYSGLSGISSTLPDDEDDVTTLRGFPIPPSPLSPSGTHAN